MNPACAICRGACCLTFELQTKDLHLSGDVIGWLSLHGVVGPGTITFDCHCRALGRDGRCTIYMERPRVCHDFAVGGPDCREAIALRRSHEEAEHILAALDGRARC